jgi:hypothetical protein
MNDEKLYTVKTFEAGNGHARGNIFFVGPFTGKEIYFRPLIKKISQRYKVYYIQPKDECLSYGSPEKLEQGINQVGEFIRQNQIKPKGIINYIKLKFGKKTNKNFVIATSLGSYFSYFNIPIFDYVDKYFLTATGGLITHVYQDSDFKKLMKIKDFSVEQVDSAVKIWSDLEAKVLPSIKLSGKSIKMINSNNDKLIQKKHTQEWFGVADLTGADVQFEYTNLPGHQAQVLALNLYSKKIEEFFG